MSKRFAYDEVKGRLTERMRMNSESATILDDSAFSNVMDVFGEGISEVARYLEYLLRENKWKTAMNMSSLTSLGSLIGRKRERPKSAIGFIIVSHTDNNNVDRLANFGSTFFSLDERSDYDNIEKDEKANYIQKSALVPWTSPISYEVPKGTIFTANNGVQFIATKTVKCKPLLKPYKEIESNETKKTEFLRAGGWENIKYLKVPVIQGIQKSQTVGTTDGTRFQAFKLNAENVENASNNTSREYFYVEVTPPKGTKPERWVEIPKIRQAKPFDKVYETKLAEDGSGVIIKFGDGVSGKLPVKGSTVTVHYLETLGSKGNIQQTFQINKMAFPGSQKMIDPRTNMESTFLSCLNTVSIMGGQDIENEDTYRENAPLSYLKSYTTAVTSSYKYQILKNSPYTLSKLICYPNSSFVAKQIDSGSNNMNEDIDEEVLNEVTLISNALNVSAIKANGDMVTDEESEDFIRNVLANISDKKGPNDSLNYVEPNYIKVAPSIKVNTYDIDISESEIIKNIKGAVTSEYSVFNTDFNTPLYSSRITHLASLFSFTDSINLQLEAMAKVEYDADKLKVFTITDEDNQDIPLVAIPFQFDSTYGLDGLNPGFKNSSLDSPYLLKINLQMINTTDADSYARTFFLFDNRPSEKVSLMDTIREDAESGNYLTKHITASNVKSQIGYDLNFFDETQDGYNKRAVRVAQYPLITNITDAVYMSKVKSPASAPFENRPYEVNFEGNNKIYNINDVEDGKFVQLSGANVSSNTTNGYMINDSYINNVHIIFNENYSEPSSYDFARGFFIIPISYFKFSSLDMTFSNGKFLEIEELSNLLKNYVSLKVFALPKQTDILTQNPNDICFIDDDDIIVERVLKYNEA